MQLDQHTVLTPPPRVSQRRKQSHQDRRARAGGQRAPEIARVLRLIGLLAPAHSTVGELPLPEVMRDWLRRYQWLGQQAPEVVGALLGVLQQTTRTVAALCTTDLPPSVSTLAAMARWAVIVPLVHRRLQPRLAATATPGCRQQHATSQEEVLPP
jgi:hypothetical protein